MSSLHSKTRATILVLATTVMALAGHATAQEIEVSALPAEPGQSTEAIRGTLSLDLLDAYEMAIHRNLDVQVARYDLAASDAGILAATGAFDPVLGAGVTGDYTKSPAATQLAGADITESRSTSFGLDLVTVLPTGTQLTAETGFRRSETNSEFFFLNPRWEGDFTLELNQPLLRGFGTLVNRSGIVIARNTRSQNAAAFEATLLGTLEQVERAYWNLVAAREAVGVNQRSLDLAQQLLNETRERVNVGTSAAIDLVQSEAGVAERQRELIYARNAAANAEDQLKRVLGFDEAAEWEVEIVATSRYEADRLQAELGPSIETALAQRPSLEQLRRQLDTLELNVKLARNATLPRLDLQASYGYSGIGGDFEFTDDNTGEDLRVRGGFQDALEQLGDRDFPHWVLGLQVSMPLGNHEAKGALAQHRWEQRRGQASLDAMKQQVISEVRLAVRALADGAAAIDAAVASREFAERNLEAEQTRFANGLSTNFQVLEIQEDLALAQLAEIRAFIDYRNAMVSYRVATGTLLDDYGIEVVDPGQPDVPNDYWKDVEWLQFVDLGASAERVTQPADPVGSEG